jgi:hypothetical protein
MLRIYNVFCDSKTLRRVAAVIFRRHRPFPAYATRQNAGSVGFVPQIMTIENLNQDKGFGIRPAHQTGILDWTSASTLDRKRQCRGKSRED